ncbi:MAG: hypothetical protein R3B67_04060 [Phycisphaerales bacterium]
MTSSTTQLMASLACGVPAAMCGEDRALGSDYSGESAGIGSGS